MRIKLFFLFFVVCLIGCATVQKDDQLQISHQDLKEIYESDPSGQKGTVIIFRNNQLTGSANNFLVSVNNKPLSIFESGDFIQIDLPIGKNLFSTEHNGKSEVLVNVEADKEHYLEVQFKHVGKNILGTGVALIESDQNKFLASKSKLLIKMAVNNKQDIPFVIRPGGFYKGELKKWQPHGKGEVAFPDGHVFEFFSGNFVSGEPNGRGVLHQANKIKVEGRFEGWAVNGPGEIHFTNGDKYQGDLKKNRMHGKGAYTHANGTMWISDFVKNNASGRGKIFHSSGRVYEGEILNWVPDGEGVLRFEDGGSAVGEFKEGKFFSGQLLDRSSRNVGLYRNGSIGSNYSSQATNSYSSGLGDIARFSLQLLGAIGAGYSQAQRQDRNGAGAYGLIDDDLQTRKSASKEVGYYTKERDSFSPPNSGNEGDGMYIINGGLGRDGVVCRKTGRLVDCW